MDLNNNKIYIAIIAASLGVIAIGTLIFIDFTQLASHVGTVFIAYFAYLGYQEFAKGKLTEKELDCVIQLITLLNTIDFVMYIKVNGLITVGFNLNTVGSNNSIDRLTLLDTTKRTKLKENGEGERYLLFTHSLILKIREIIAFVDQPITPYAIRNSIYQSSLYKNFRITNLLTNTIPLINIKDSEDVKLGAYIVLDELKSKNLLNTPNGRERFQMSIEDIRTEMMQERITVQQLEEDLSSLIKAINKWLDNNNLKDKKLVTEIYQA